MNKTHVISAQGADAHAQPQSAMAPETRSAQAEPFDALIADWQAWLADGSVRLEGLKLLVAALAPPDRETAIAQATLKSQAAAFARVQERIAHLQQDRERERAAHASDMARVSLECERLSQECQYLTDKLHIVMAEKRALELSLTWRVASRIRALAIRFPGIRRIGNLSRSWRRMLGKARPPASAP
ncbi:hypothetical protein [Nitrospirillum amazonense]|uniref:hypothetical protein n=1 Tax=Nitrospirillum amazonense TaxID=28077 RepID=UPI0011A5033E|nr:hypothetical protein [Nitrospirillum amazonense]